MRNWPLKTNNIHRKIDTGKHKSLYNLNEAHDAGRALKRN
jgi:hypothetical protein